MIIILNNQKFEIYELENKSTIINRIAVKLNTLPIYLYFEPELDLKKCINEDYKISVTDYLDIIKKYKGLEIVKLYKSIKEKILNITFQEVLYPWLYYSKDIKDIIKQEKTIANTMLIEFNDEIKKLNEITEDIYIDNIKMIIKETKNKFEKDIEELSIKVSKDIEIMKKYYNIKKGVDYEEINIEKSEINYILDMEYITLLEIFNNIILNKNIPFACYNNFYKISKDIMPFEEWKTSLNEYILLRILEKKNPKFYKSDNYSLSIIGKEENYPVIRMICNFSPNNISQEEYIKNVFTTLQEPKIKDIKEELIKGTFIIPNQTLDKYVFADLVMNNDIFSKFVYINERESASKMKSEIYIYLSHPIYGLMTCNMIEYNDIAYYDSYVRVHITKSTNMRSIYEFQNIISKLFYIYNEEYENIIEEYREYIPDFGKIVKKKNVKSKEILRLKDVAPQILEYKSDIQQIEEVTGKPKKKLLYSRMCDKLPRVVSKEEAEKIGNYMIYPKDSKFVPQNYYVCDEHMESGHIYPGLTLNKLNSYEKVIGLPCCYKEDHSKNKGTLYRQYYFDEDISRDSKKVLSQKMILTNKFVNITSTGILPKNILNYFESIDPINEYRRTGMSRGPNSFIECVLEGLGIDIFSNIITDIDKRNNYVDKIRKTKLSEIVKKYGICRQELYNKSNKQIYEYIKSDEYFDPKMFITLLEQVYNCNIFLFQRNNFNEGGELTLPYYSQYYLKYNNNYPCIFIYENPGNVADNPIYPQCELIINFKETNSIYSFDSNNDICLQTKKVYENMSTVYLYNKPIKMIDFNIDIELINSQLIDNNGKCRVLYVDYESDIISIITDPLPPLMVNEIKKSKKIIINKLNIKKINKFCKIFNITIIKQVVINNVLKQIIGLINNIHVCIPIIDTIPLENIEITNELIFIENKNSNMDIYNNNKKYARYICEYAIWLLSNYLYKTNKYQELNIDVDIVLKEFFNENIIIDPKFIYKPIKEKFTYESGILNNEKLVLLNKITYDRLYYYVKLFIKRDYQKLVNYRLYNSMENYFQDITDMTLYTNQVILYGIYAVEKWISERKTNYLLTNSIKINYDKPYFFKNNYIDDNIYLAQNINDIKKAINIAKKWIDEKYNIGIKDSISESNIYESELYIYKNKMDIKLYKIKGIENSYNIKILGYKLKMDDKSELQNMYTVLLNI